MGENKHTQIVVRALNITIKLLAKYIKSRYPYITTVKHVLKMRSVLTLQTDFVGCRVQPKF